LFTLPYDDKLEGETFILLVEFDKFDPIFIEVILPVVELDLAILSMLA
jgi:hypothetical protein